MRRLRGVLRIFAALFLGAAFVYGAGPVLGSLPLVGHLLAGFEPFFGELPFVTNSVVKVTALGFCCLYAAGDLRRRHGLVAVVVAAHLVSVAAMGVLLAAGRADATVQLGGSTVAESTVLWGAMALDAVVTGVLVAFYLPARSVLPRGGGGRAPYDAGGLVGAERRLRGALRVLGGLFAAAALAYEAGPLLESTRAFFVELPFVTNSVVRSSLLAMVCLWVAADLRPRMGVLYPVLAAHAVSVLVAGL